VIESPPPPKKPDSPVAPRPRRGRLFPSLGVSVPAVILIGIAIAFLLLPSGVGPTDRSIVNIAAVVLAFAAFCVLAVWFTLGSGYTLAQRLMGWIGVIVIVTTLRMAVRIDGVSGWMMPKLSWRWTVPPDQRLAVPQPVSDKVAATASRITETTDNDFPQFLGKNRDVKVEGVLLERSWQTRKPKELWRQPIGAGWSGFTVVNGVAVTMEQRGDEELVTCYDALTGELLWFHATDARHSTALGGVGPRSTPTIHDGKVYALGATGMLHCLDGATGEEVWPDIDVCEVVGVTAKDDSWNVAWGRAASPLIVDDLVVVPGGGPAGGRRYSLVAFDKNTGEKQWAQGSKQISYSSPALATLAGVRQILIVNEDTAAGHDATTGEQLWEYPWPGSSNTQANTSQAVAVGDDGVFLSKGYGQGSALLRLSVDADGRWSVEELWRNERALRTKLTNVAIRDGHANGLSDGILECVKLETGESAWKRGRYQNGQILLVGDTLLVMSETGTLALVDAVPDEYRELDQFKALDGKCWNTLCLYGPYLLVRNNEEAACYELPLR